MNISDLSASQLRRAAALKERIEKLHKEFTILLGAATPAPTAPDGQQKKRKLSAATRKKMAASHQARWAKIKGTAKPTSAATAAPAAMPARKKWKLSAAGKARIKAANKAYWAKVKAAKEKK
jgi:hypothetical protein